MLLSPLIYQFQEKIYHLPLSPYVLCMPYVVPPWQRVLLIPYLVLVVVLFHYVSSGNQYPSCPYMLQVQSYHHRLP